MSTILFMEDEHAWRAVFGEFLRNEGFTVLEAADMTEAVDACNDYSGQVDLSIVDIKSGTRLVRRLAERYPQMSVLFVGDAEKKISAPGLKSSYLRKPFSSQALLRSVRGLIDSGTVASRTASAS